MDDRQDSPTEFEQLRMLGKVQEQPFTSDAPVVGGLIVWVRTVWNSVSTKWYVRPMVDQQNAFNETVVEKLEVDRERVRADVAEVLAQTERTAAILDERLVAQDRDQVQAIHDLGELAARLTALRGAVSGLETRLARLERDND